MATAVQQVVGAVLDGGAKQAVKYLSPTEVVKATYQGKRDRRNTRHTVLVTVGRPNYTDRKHIRRLKAAGESFPVRKVRTKFPSGG